MDELQNDVILMDDAHNFFKTDLGKWFMVRIDEEVEVAIEKLKTVDPEDPKMVRAAQNEVRIPETLKIWFNEILIQGELALEQLNMDEE